jgi:ABC-type phosphate/phosphonate transport system substrate-binding protein
MAGWIANARMYSVTPAVETDWRELLAQVAQAAQVPLTYLPYPAPQPLEALWSRADLGAVFMCGYPVALKMAAVIPLAAPIPDAPWAQGRAVYRSDLIVRADAPYHTLADTFGGRAGWTVSHSQSGFNAFRHELLAHLTPQRPALYREVTGNLITARAILDGVREGRLDVGPLDAYWHLLIARHAPQLVEGVRVLASTPLTPMPPLVIAAAAPPQTVQRLRTALLEAHRQAWFAPLGQRLLLKGFEAASESAFAPYLEWDREARAAGYPVPA